MLVGLLSLLVYLCYFIMKTICSSLSVTAKCALPKEMDPSEGESRPLYGAAGPAVPRFLARCHVPLNSPVPGLRRSTLYCKLGWPYPALGETEGATASSSCLKLCCPPRVPHSRNWGCGHSRPDSGRRAEGGWPSSTRSVLLTVQLGTGGGSPVLWQKAQNVIYHRPLHAQDVVLWGEQCIAIYK